MAFKRPTVASLIRRRRTLKLSQRKLAIKAGVRPATLCVLEQQRPGHIPRLETLLALADALDKLESV